MYFKDFSTIVSGETNSFSITKEHFFLQVRDSSKIMESASLPLTIPKIPDSLKTPYQNFWL